MIMKFISKSLLCQWCCLLVAVGLSGQESGSSAGKPGMTVSVVDGRVGATVTEVFVSLEQIRQLPEFFAITQGEEGKPDREWAGVRLCDISKMLLDVSCDNISKVTVSAADGYQSVVSGKLLSGLKTAICTYSFKDKKNWPKKYGYARLVFPDLTEMYWVNEPTTMTITVGQRHDQPHRMAFYFLESNRLRSLIRRDMQNTPYVVLADIFVELGVPANDFYIVTADKLRREYQAGDINRYLVLQKEESGTWELNGLGVPLGLKTREITFVGCGDKGIFLKELSGGQKSIWEDLVWRPLCDGIQSTEPLSVSVVLDGDEVAPSSQMERQAMKDIYSYCVRMASGYDNLDHILVEWQDQAPREGGGR